MQRQESMAHSKKKNRHQQLSLEKNVMSHILEKYFKMAVLNIQRTEGKHEESQEKDVWIK